MKNNLTILTLFLLLLFGSTQSFAQSIQDKPVYKHVEQMPQYEGGFGALMQFLSSSVTNVKTKAKGKVELSFVVDSDGSVNDIHVIKSLNREVDEACIQAIKATEGKWSPGRQDGEAVAVRFVLPLSFKR